MPELTVPVFVISLPNATRKQEEVKKHMQNLGIPFEFVWGVDGRLLSEEELQKVFDREKSYNYYKWYRNRSGAGGVELSRGEIGCTLAHRKVYRKMVDENIRLAVVLEDDVFVTEDFLPVVEKIIAGMENNSMGKNLIVKLDKTTVSESFVFYSGGGGVNIRIKMKNLDFWRSVQIKIDSELAIVKSPMNLGGAQGYIIDNAAAHTMLSVNSPVFVISDEWNYHARFVRVRVLNKTIAPTRIMGSDIWNSGHPQFIPIPFKYRYLGILKKAIIKTYLLLWR